MALVLKDRVKETCTGTSADMTFTGAVSGFAAFSVIGNANQTYYVIEDADTTKWEVGIGTYTLSGTTFSRDTILANQISGTDTTKQTFSGGVHTIYCVYPAEKSVNLDASGNLSHTVVLTTDTSGNYVATVTGGTGITSTGATSGEGIAHSLSVDASQTQITSVGTIATGEWRSTDVAILHGGTGASTDSDARTNLGVAIGSDVQAHDPQLDSVATWSTAQVTTLGNIGTVTTAADKMIYTTSADTFAETDLTEAGRDILDDANAADQRTTLGVDAAGTDNSPTATIAGSYDYISAGGTKGHTLTLAQIDLSTDVTGTLPVGSVSTITLGTNTAGNYVGTVTGGTGITSTGATTGEGIAHSLSVDASQTQITSVGTIGAGTWEGDVIGASYLPVLNSITAPTGDVSLNSNKITSLTDPTAAQDAATKSYVDAIKSGLDIKDSCVAATTAAGTLASSFENGDVIDGVTLATNDRILIKDQSTGSENGIYTVNASGAPTRATDFDTDAEVTSGAFTFVEEGTVNSDAGLVLTTNDPITVGSTALTFTQFSGAGQITAGDGLTKSGNTIDAVGTSNKIDVSADAITISPTYVGQTSITTLSTIATGTWEATDVAVLHGGTGASSAADARTNLGITYANIGTVDISANTNLAGGTGITLTDDTLSTTDSEIVHDNLSGFVANEHIDHSSVSIASGTGLSGGGDLTSTRTLSVDASQTQITSVGAIAVGSWAATDVAVLHGGTGSSTAGGARTNLGVAIDSDVQAWDAQLDTLATWSAAQVTTIGNIGTITTAADKMIYTTAADTFAETAITAFGRSILDDTDEAAFKATVNLEIGTDVQAYDADLAAIAGLTSAADKGIQFTGAGTAATYDLTAAGKALLDDLSAAAQLTTLGAAPAAGSSSILTVGALDSGSITSNFGSINNGSSTITTTGAITGGSLDVSEGNITNVGSIACDSVIVDAAATGLDIVFGGVTTTNKITLTDNLADALNITESTNSYMKFVTTNSSESIVFGKNSTFSGTTIADLGTVTTANITVGSGKTLDVSAGTLTTSAAQNLAIVQGAASNIDIGTFSLTANTLVSDVATGTSPLTVSSTTVVANLNADLLDGQEGSYYLDYVNFAIDDDEIPIAKLASDSVSYGGVEVTLGASDATPAFALADATGLPIVAGTTGTLSVARGGTGATTLTDGGVLLGNGTGAVVAMAELADGEIIVGDGTTDPVALAAFSSSTGTLNVASGGTGATTLDDLITLGTHTTGNYVATIAGTSNEIEVTGSGSETAAVTIGLPADVTISGNLTVSGDTTTVNTTTLSVEDPLIILASANSAADVLDIGFYGLYDTSGSLDLYAGLFRDAGDSGKFKLFKDLQEAPTTTVNTSGTGYAKATLVADIEGALAGNATTATALATGRTIGMTGDVVWTSASFTGAGNVTGAATIQALSVDNGMLAGSIANAKLVNDSVTVGTTEIDLGSSATTLAGLASVTSTAFVGALTGNADTATALAATGNIAATGDIAWNVDFSGSNVTAAATIQADAVDSAEIVAGAIDFAHIQDVAANSILGRNANSSGVLSEIALTTTQILIGDGTGFTAAALSGDVTMTNAGVVSIADDVVDSAELADACSAVTSFTAPLIEGSTSVQTPLIEYTNGDSAITINSGGSVKFEKAFTGAASSANTASGSDPNMVITLDLATANFFRVQLGDGEDVTAINFTNPTVGQTFLIRLEQPGSGTKATVVWTDVDAPDATGALVYWPGGVAPTLTETNSKSDMIGFVCTANPAGSTMAFDGFIVGQNMSIPA